jgi:hypothetical protein
MLYWLSVWTIGVSLLTATISPWFALYVVTCWFLGTVIVSKLLGRRTGYVFAVVIGFVSCLGASFAIALWEGAAMEMAEDFAILSFASAWFGVLFGTAIWSFVIAADEIFKHFAKS